MKAVAKKIQSPAKINLSLEIIEKLPDGFHRLRTVMTKMENLRDDMLIRFDPESNGLSVSCDLKNVPDGEKNICHKAASVFFKETGLSVGLKIKIKKRIPAGAGLGGGSSNAASVFSELNEYFQKPLSRKKLIDIAQSVGKDIPFFFSPKNSALIEGAGEKISLSFDIPRARFLLINPKIHISTPEAFADLDKNLWFMQNKKRLNLSEKLIRAVKKNGFSGIPGNLYNDFELVAEKKHPVIKEIKQALLVFGASASLMTGSGSTVFGIFESDQKADRAKNILRKKYPGFLIVAG